MLVDFKWPDLSQIDYSKVYDVVLMYGLRIIVALVLLFIGLKLIKWLIKRINRRLDKSKIDSSLKSFVSPLISIILKVTLLLSIVSMFGIQVTSFIALLGSIGFAIGLALQGSLSNFAGGVLILILKPYKVGDYIEAQGYSGTVKEIHIFYTVLVTFDNKKVVIPNASLSNASLTNYTSYPTRRLELKISCSYDNDVLEVQKVLENYIKSHSKVLEDPEPGVYLTAYGDSAITFSIRGFTKSSDYWETYYDLMLHMKSELDKHHITIPYPQLDVHVKKTHQ